MPPFSRIRTLCGRKHSAVGERPSPQPLDPLPVPSRSDAGSLLAPYSNSISPSQRHVQIAQGLRSSLPSTCRWLRPGSIEIVGEHPIAAGRFADIWEGKHSDRKVVLKSYRCYTSLDVAQVVARFCNEVRACDLLRHGDANVVPLVGVYSTEKHPFGLVYEHMDNFDLRQYLKNEPNACRLELLVVIAKCLRYMHSMNVIHGHLETANILVDEDGTALIAGLGSVSVLSHSAGRTAEDMTSAGRLPRGDAPEVVRGSSRPTKASDMYAFGVVAWEVFTGRPPFFEMTEIAATYSMANGARPLRPNNHKISGRIWYMVERCWHAVPSRRVSIEEVVDFLETERRRAVGSGV